MHWKILVLFAYKAAVIFQHTEYTAVVLDLIQT
jgi:hypothetical protein